VPDSALYDVSWTDFKNEKLENFKWNYVDQYICTKGEDDYELTAVSTYALILTNDPVTLAPTSTFATANSY
jgi:hypothetical protein